MDPRKNFKPSHDVYDRDRGGSDSGVNQVNPHDTPRTRPDGETTHQGGDPSEVRPIQPNANRDAQPDGHRDLGYNPQQPDTNRRRGGSIPNSK